MTENELQETYDMIRSPSDDLADDAAGTSPAKSRWLESKETPGSRSSSPPLERHDPSKMAGLSQRLYESGEAASTDAPSQDPAEPVLSTAGELLEPEDIVGDLLRMMNDERRSDTTNPASAHHEELKPACLDVINEQQVWRAAKDPTTGLIYYFHIKTKEVRDTALGSSRHTTDVNVLNEFISLSDDLGQTGRICRNPRSATGHTHFGHLRLQKRKNKKEGPSALLGKKEEGYEVG